MNRKQPSLVYQDKENLAVLCCVIHKVFLVFCLFFFNMPGARAHIQSFTFTSSLTERTKFLFLYSQETAPSLTFILKCIFSVYEGCLKDGSQHPQQGTCTTDHVHFFSVLLQIIMLGSVSELQGYIDKTQLTEDLGGTLDYCHNRWLSRRTVSLRLCFNFSV